MEKPLRDGGQDFFAGMSMNLSQNEEKDLLSIIMTGQHWKTSNRAIELVVHTSTDQFGNTVDEEDQFGMKQNIRITHPSYIMFADESGFSTSQKKDGHVGGQKFVVESGTFPQIASSATDHKFTLLPFTSATGKAICCVIIFQSIQELTTVCNQF